MKNYKFEFYFYLISFLLTFIITLLFKWQIISSSLNKFSMLIPSIIAIIIFIFLNKEKLRKSIGFFFKPNRYWFPPIIISFIFVLLSFAITKVFKENIFLSLDEMGCSNALLKFSSNTTNALFTVFLLNVLLAPLINIFMFLGEEIGWRSYLNKSLTAKLGFKGTIVTGVLWGIWHIPMIMIIGLNYPHTPIIGSFIFLLFCICLNVVWGYWYQKAGSIIPIAYAHGVVNWTTMTFFMFIINKDNMNNLLYGPTGLIGLVILLIIAAFHVKPYLKILKTR